MKSEGEEQSLPPCCLWERKKGKEVNMRGRMVISMRENKMREVENVEFRYGMCS